MRSAANAPFTARSPLRDQLRELVVTRQGAERRQIRIEFGPGLGLLVGVWRQALQ
jgi:hypothetical protein